jgi:hypothetical protein
METGVDQDLGAAPLESSNCGSRSCCRAAIERRQKCLESSKIPFGNRIMVIINKYIIVLIVINILLLYNNIYLMIIII